MSRDKRNRKEWRAKYYVENREKQIKYSTEYRARNKERVAEYQAGYYPAYRKKNKEKLDKYGDDYRAKNKEQIAKKKAEYHDKNKEYICEKSRLWGIENKEQKARTAKAYRIKRKDDPEVRRNSVERQKKYQATPAGKIKTLATKARRRARKRSAATEEFTHKEVFERDGYICQLCGDTTRPDYNNHHPLFPNLDHIRPLSKGGDHTKANTQCLCHQCNMVKGNKWAAPPKGVAI